MVSTQGFNALLKLVEEPPPHLRFIFATTEPEKVIPTIRSRTHHYPFRLIPPRLLTSYLSDLCELEQVTIEPAALPLVVRAGAGSARDTLSVLDQLMGGAGPDGITHTLAAGLLGYTPDALLDEVVDAFAAGDGSAVFGVVDKVIETGQDPRRFTEDLLRRLRDLVIVSAVPDAPATGLIDIAEDAAERLVAQAARFGPAELTRAADLVATGLTEMRGATAPRLLLELICARVLLPGADHSTEGVLARLDRLERRMTITGGDPSPAPTAPTEPASVKPAPSIVEPTVIEPVRPAASQAPPAPEAEEPEPAPTTTDNPPATTSAGSTLTLVDVRRLWPDIVEATKQRRRLTWIYLTQQAQVVGVDDQTLTLGFANAGARDSFDSGGSAEIVRQAAIDVVGHDWRVETIVDPGADPEAGRPPASVTEPTAAPTQPAGHQIGTPPSPEPGTAAAPDPGPAEPERAPVPVSPAERPSASAREAIAPTRGAVRPGESAEPADPDGGARSDDTDAESDGLDGAQLLQEALGAQVIDEIPHQ
jgi:DNA polymerase-3 subunit gamma/tau